jgi:putative NIF3 family GTP cyclohydrolase 1 type 2
MCTITLDATDAVGRVVFANTANLGILSHPDYTYGNVLTVE